MKTKLKMVEDNNEVVCDRVFDYSVVIRKGYYGIIDKDGSVIVPFDYHYIWPWGLDNYLVVQKWRKYGIIDLCNNVVVPIEYDYILPINKHLFKVKVGNKSGVINDSGELVIPIIYDVINNLRYTEELFLLKFGEAYGLANGQGKTTGPIFEYIDLRNYPDDLFRVKLNGKWIFINSKLEKVPAPAGVDPLYDDIIQTLDRDISVVREDGKYGLMNANEEFLIPCIYESLNWSDAIQCAEVRLNGKCGVVDKHGKYLIEPIYDKVYVDRNSYVGVLLDGKWGCIGIRDNEGVSIPCMYDAMGLFDKDGHAVVNIDGKYGAIDTDNNIVVPQEYDRAYYPGIDSAIGFEKIGEGCVCFSI